MAIEVVELLYRTDIATGRSMASMAKAIEAISPTRSSVAYVTTDGHIRLVIPKSIARAANRLMRAARQCARQDAAFIDAQTDGGTDAVFPSDGEDDFNNDVRLLEADVLRLTVELEIVPV